MTSRPRAQSQPMVTYASLITYILSLNSMHSNREIFNKFQLKLWEIKIVIHSSDAFSPNQSDEPLFAPTGSPAVLRHPIIGAIVRTPADDHHRVNSLPSLTRVDIVGQNSTSSERPFEIISESIASVTDRTRSHDPMPPKRNRWDRDLSELT